MKHRHTASRKPRRHIAAALFLSALCLALAVCLLVQTDSFQYRLIDYGLVEKRHQSNRSTISAWDSCLEQLQCDADLAFFGDSLTCMHDFQADFPDRAVVNLGLNGDTILDMTERAYMLATVRPEKVFLMGGINSLRNEAQIDRHFAQYTRLCEAIRKAAPAADLYILSVLPVSADHDDRFLGNLHGVNNNHIRRFNAMIRQYAEENGVAYIDLYPFYEKDGALNPELSRDGIHLTDTAYRYWIDAIREYVYD